MLAMLAGPHEDWFDSKSTWPNADAREAPSFLQQRLLENDRSFDQLRRHCRREEEHRTGGESRQENNCGDRERALHRSI
jgi:hypothetical protein